MDFQIHYTALGTFEFLVHESKPEYYFLEVNPRLQVEHTISEEIAGVDLVRCQLMLAQGISISDLDLPDTSQPPRQHAMQFRITAEDVSRNFTLSMGRIASFSPPSGQGVRFDTHLSTTKPTTVGSSYDSLLAKLVVKSQTYESARMKAVRALGDIVINGITTNTGLLMGIATSPDFSQKRCSTRWLEDQLSGIIQAGETAASKGTLSSREPYLTTSATESTTSATAGLGNAGILFRKGDAFKMELTDSGRANDRSAKREEYLLKVDRVLANDFPKQLTADVTFSTAASSKSYGMNLTSTTQTSVASSRHRYVSPEDQTHIGLPFAGQFVELLVDEGDIVKEGESLCVVKQMKMELVLRAPFAGTVKWVCDVDEGETVNENLLVCELQPADERDRRKSRTPFKL
jgi:pyruvate carboxylase